MNPTMLVIAMVLLAWPIPSGARVPKNAVTFIPKTQVAPWFKPMLKPNAQETALVRYLDMRFVSAGGTQSLFLLEAANQYGVFDSAKGFTRLFARKKAYDQLLLTPADAVVAVDATSTIYVASSLAGLAVGTLTKQGALPSSDATLDSSEPVLWAHTKKELWASQDNGKTFVAVVLPEADGYFGQPAISNFMARSDGAIYMKYGKSAFTYGPPPSTQWRPAPAHSVELLGDLFYYSKCRSALDRSGRNWRSYALPEVFYPSSMRGGHLTRSSGRVATRTFPASRVGGRLRANCKEPSRPPSGQGRIFGSRSVDKVGVEAMRETFSWLKPISATGRYWIMSPGLCRSKKPLCSRSAKTSIAASALEYSRKTGWSLLAIPTACHSGTLSWAHGLALLVCTESRRTGVYLHAAGSKAWHREASLPWGQDDNAGVLMASDGTLLLRRKCTAKGCEDALVRRPVAIGTAKAWRRLKTHGGVQRRPLTGGDVFVVRSSGVGDTLKLVMERSKADGKVESLATIPVTAPKRAYGVALTLRPDGRLYLTLEVEQDSYYITTGSTLFRNLE